MPIIYGFSLRDRLNLAFGVKIQKIISLMVKKKVQKPKINYYIIWSIKTLITWVIKPLQVCDMLANQREGTQEN